MDPIHLRKVTYSFSKNLRILSHDVILPTHALFLRLVYLLECVTAFESAQTYNLALQFLLRDGPAAL